MRLLLLLCICALAAVALLPLRMKSWEKVGSSYSDKATEKYFDAVEEHRRVMHLPYSNDARAKAANNLARALCLMRRFEESDRLYFKVYTERKALMRSFVDPLLVEAALGAAQVRRDMGAVESAVAMYETILKYDQDMRAEDRRVIARDRSNLGIALYLAAKRANDRSQKELFMKRAGESLERAINETKALAGRESVEEANMLESLSYILAAQGKPEESLKAKRSAAEIYRALNRPCLEL